MKYLSIMIVIPKNIVSNAPIGDVFPGIPIIVALSVFLMFWGSLNLYKRKNFIIAFSGLILYTISPWIASAAVPTHFSIVTSYAAGYYLGWIGLVLIVVDKFFLHRILKTPAPTPLRPKSQRTTALMSIMPFFAVALFLTQLHNMHFNFSVIQFQDFSTGFEEAHHAVASVFTGVVAGVSAGVITTSVFQATQGTLVIQEAHQSTKLRRPHRTPAQPPEPETTGHDGYGSDSSTPQEPPDIDEINQAKKQQEINEKYMSDFKKTLRNNQRRHRLRRQTMTRRSTMHRNTSMTRPRNSGKTTTKTGMNSIHGKQNTNLAKLKASRNWRMRLSTLRKALTGRFGLASTRCQEEEPSLTLTKSRQNLRKALATEKQGRDLGKAGIKDRRKTGRTLHLAQT